MSNAREQKVLSKLVDIQSRLNYAIDRMTDLREPLARGDRIVVPNVEALTVYPDGSVPRTASDRNNPTPTELTLIVNQEPFIPVQVPKVSSIENLGGNWDEQLAEQVMIALRNYMDSLLLDSYLTGQICWVASGAANYTSNVASDSLTPTDLLVARGLQMRKGGTQQRNLMWVFDPLAIAAVMGFPGWQNQAQNADSFGAETLGRIYGIEAVEDQGVRTAAAHAILTAVIASNVLTVTFATNPGLQVGVPCTIAGLTSTSPTGTPVVSVSADGLTATFADTGSNGSVWQAGATVTENSACNLLLDRSHVYTAIQQIPSVTFMEDPDTTGQIMKSSALFGMLARVGRVRQIRSPDAGI